MDWLADFENPGPEYRGAPFWAWNDKLDPEELRRQIRVFKAMGLGGFFMHSRVGLDTPYLSEEWMACIAACVEEADKQNMLAWLYDEDRWPSGAAGGLATRGPEFRCRTLEIHRYDSLADAPVDKTTLAVFAVRMEWPEVRDVRKLQKRDWHGALGAGETALVFRVQVAEDNTWYNGSAYLDTLNPEAVRRFLDITHEAYKRQFHKHFGGLIPGIFTDEPNFPYYRPPTSPDGPLLGTAPWTGKLPATFKHRYGYDLRNRLVDLFFDTGEPTAAQTRWHYHDCVTHLFTESFARQIGEWCEAHNLPLTGHVLMEETLTSQTRTVGSSMRFYEHMQIPGMDLLTQFRREYDTAKQVSSAARQFGRRWRLTETYGCTGWEFPFAGHKALGDWQVALGINYRCPHLSFYSMRGEAKRDYPASISFQSPWWEQYRVVEDYFARVHALMSRGEEVRDVLVIHPIESMWCAFRAGGEKLRETLEDRFWRLRDCLLEHHLDFDYGDEDILARHGAVAEAEGVPVLNVAQAQYKVVVVPRAMTIRATTLELLETFKNAGGMVIFIGAGPERVDAAASNEARALAKECVVVSRIGSALAAEISTIGRRLSIVDPDGAEVPQVLYCLREDADAWLLFMANVGHNLMSQRWVDPAVSERTVALPDVRVVTSFGAHVEPVELNAEDGSILTTDCQKMSDGWAISTSFPPLGSRIFVFPKGQRQLEAQPRIELRQTRSRTVETWDARLTDDNCLVLDRPTLRIGGGEMLQPQDVIQADEMVRAHIGAPKTGKDMVQPWARPHVKDMPSVDVELEYAFDVDALPSGPVHLAIEEPSRYVITLNGIQINIDSECGWWVDQATRRVPVDAGLLARGANVLRLRCEYCSEHPGLEIVYFLGAFGATLRKGNPVLVAAPEGLALGDWTKQGLTFYGGSVIYTCSQRLGIKKGERLFLEVPWFEGAGIRVWVDGRPIRTLGWPPYETEITEFSDGQSYVLGVEVLGHRRNSHGPFHLKNQQPSWIGPAQFRPSPEERYEGYRIVPVGLMEAPVLSYRRNR